MPKYCVDTEPNGYADRKADERNPSPAETIVLDEAELEELDKLSLTGIMRDVTGTVKQIEQESGEPDEKDNGLDSLDLGYLVSED